MLPMLILPGLQRLLEGRLEGKELVITDPPLA